MARIRKDLMVIRRACKETLPATRASRLPAEAEWSPKAASAFWRV